MSVINTSEDFIIAVIGSIIIAIGRIAINSLPADTMTGETYRIIYLYDINQAVRITKPRRRGNRSEKPSRGIR